MKKLIFVFCFLFLTGCSGSDDYDELHVENNIYTAYAADNVAKATSPDIQNPNIEPVYNNKVIGEFVTKYNVNNSNRVHNLTLAVIAIDGTIVNPGQTFSYNETLGPTSKENGFKKATVFKKGKEYKGYGGGVCQVSSTLFNACDDAGLETIERHNHSKEVHYVKEGRDAATSYGGVDYKFKNNKTYPVLIKASAKDGNLSVTLRAAPSKAPVSNISELNMLQ